MSDPHFNINRLNKKGDLVSTPIRMDYLQEIELPAKGSYGGHLGRKFEDYDGNISVKSDYNRSDYEWFRQNTSCLDTMSQVKVSQKSYEKVSIVRQIVDMMGEFTCQGIRIEHPNPKKRRFLEEWFRYVHGQHVSERFSNMLYRLGNVPVQTAMGKLVTPNEKKMSVSKGTFDEADYYGCETERRMIPLQYTFIAPWELEVIGGELGLFIGQPIYAVKIPGTLKSEVSKVDKINNPDIKNRMDAAIKKLSTMVSQIGNQIYLNPDRFQVYFYKKDDWQSWAIPMIGAILDDLVMLERMKLADMSALDGSISNIRHWVVGIIDPANITNSIIPTKAGINHMKSILTNGVGGGTMDLVTGPEVQMKESNSQVYKFLGHEKYKTTLDSIYDGLGVPPPLRSGTSGGSNSSTNNYISLKTLMERLNYGRSVLVSFWNKQLEIVQKALGHKYPGRIVFDHMILSDESAEKRLIIDLLDRDIISSEAVRQYFGFIPSLENTKVNREFKARKTRQTPPKASPYHSAEQDFEYKKILLQNGDVTPSEVEVELEEKKPGEVNRQQFLADEKIKQVAAKPKPTGTQGRPKNVTETRKRKPKPNFRPRTSADVILWANSAHQYITENLSSVILKNFGKKNFRQLTTAEAKEAEDFKFNVFSNLTPLCELNTVALYAALQKSERGVSLELVTSYEKSVAEFIQKNQREPSAEEKRQLQILSVVEINFKDFSEKHV